MKNWICPLHRVFWGECSCELPKDHPDYKPVPPRRVHTAKVIYIYRGRGTPLAYPSEREA